jgi:hypothetical protein
MYDLRPLIKEIKAIVDTHYLGKPGEYSRWISQDATNSRDLGSTPYGCANAVNILYTIGELSNSFTGREAFIRVLQGFQNERNGLFEVETNFSTHTTAFVAGAFNLLDSKPQYLPTGFNQYADKEGLYALMESIDWVNDPWLGAHKGAGIYGSMVVTGYATDEWEDYYFDWLDDNADPVTGLWKKASIYNEDGTLKGAPLFHHLASTFHYVFNYEYAKRALPYPKELLDTCITAYHSGACPKFDKVIGWADIDFTYLLCRTQRRAGTRYEESQQILKEIADGFIGQLLKMKDNTYETLNDLNNLFAVVCALAVLQDALPGYIRTSKPLKLVLDRRPFL